MDIRLPAIQSAASRAPQNVSATPRFRASLACTPCRSKHTRCDGIKPVCENCQTEGKTCIWPISGRGPKDPSKQIQAAKANKALVGQHPNRPLSLTTTATRTTQPGAQRPIVGRPNPNRPPVKPGPRYSRAKIRAPVACIPCRSKHYKCDAALPACARCQDVGRECTYVDSCRGIKDPEKRAMMREEAILAESEHKIQEEANYANFTLGHSLASGSGAVPMDPPADSSKLKEEGVSRPEDSPSHRMSFAFILGPQVQEDTVYG